MAKATDSAAVISASGTAESGFLLTTLQSMANWCRKNSVWPLPLGLSCCGIEFMATAASRYDMARFGMEVARFSPRQADLLLVAGTLTYKMAHVMTRLYDQMAEPKWVVAMGACASTGGMYRSYPVVQGIDEFLPVDVFVAGCPPRPEAVLNALIQLQKKIEKDRTYRVTTKPDPLAPLSRSPPRAGPRRGEMSPRALASVDERWVEGHPPKVGVPPGPTAPQSCIAYVEAPPANVRPEVGAILAAFGARWSDYAGLGAGPRYRDDPAALLRVESFADAIRRLRDEAGFDFLLDHTAVDYPDRDPRFTVLAILLRLSTMERLVVKARVAEDRPVPTISHLYAAADWAERETYDMFGIPFEGHPDLTRIYLPADFEGWPERRDFPCEGSLRFRD